MTRKYRDRPADEGKHGDAAEEQNAGVPSSASDGPVHPKSSSNRQQNSLGQAARTKSPEVDGKRFGRPRRDHGGV